MRRGLVEGSPAKFRSGAPSPLICFIQHKGCSNESNYANIKSWLWRHPIGFLWSPRDIISHESPAFAGIIISQLINKSQYSPWVMCHIAWFKSDTNFSIKDKLVSIMTQVMLWRTHNFPFIVYGSSHIRSAVERFLTNGVSALFLMGMS